MKINDFKPGRVVIYEPPIVIGLSFSLESNKKEQKINLLIKARSMVNDSIILSKQVQEIRDFITAELKDL